MNERDAVEFTESLGQIAIGTWRQVALGARLGVPDALGLTTREWVEDRLGGYVRLGVEERREAVAELVEEGMTQREIADVVGQHESTISRDVDALADASDESDEAAVEHEVDGPSLADASPDPGDVNVLSDETLTLVEGEDDRLAAAERDARLLSIVTKAIAAVAPLTTALPAAEAMLARLDRDRLDLLGPRVESAAETVALLAKRARDLQRNGPRLVKGGRS